MNLQYEHEKIQGYHAEGSDQDIDSIIERNINVSKYKPLGGSSCIKLSKELDCSKQGVINIQNKGNNKCLKRRLVRFLHPVDKDPTRIGKIPKILQQNLISKT